MFCGHLFSFLCPCVPSPLRVFLISPLCFFYPYNLALPICSPCHRTLNTCCHHALTKMACQQEHKESPCCPSPPTMLPLSATTMIHQWPLPFALDGLLEKADAKPRKALTEDIRKDLRDSAVNNVALIHQSLKTSTLLCPIWRLSSCNPSAGYFGGSSGRKVGRSSITRGENSQASLQI